MWAIGYRKKRDLARKTVLRGIIADFLHKAIRFIKTTL
jgi:hypothetical protein